VEYDGLCIFFWSIDIRFVERELEGHRWLLDVGVLGDWLVVDCLRYNHQGVDVLLRICLVQPYSKEREIRSLYLEERREFSNHYRDSRENCGRYIGRGWRILKICQESIEDLRTNITERYSLGLVAQLGDGSKRIWEMSNRTICINKECHLFPTFERSCLAT